MVCVLVFVRTSDWTVPIAVIQTGDQIAIDLLNKTFCVHLLCTKGLVFLCNKPSCRNYACINFYMKANVHRADRRDDIYCINRVGEAYSIYGNEESLTPLYVFYDCCIVKVTIKLDILR